MDPPVSSKKDNEGCSSDDVPGIDWLPVELMECIFNFLPQATFARVATVCYSWSEILKSPSIPKTVVVMFNQVEYEADRDKWWRDFRDRINAIQPQGLVWNHEVPFFGDLLHIQGLVQLTSLDLSHCRLFDVEIVRLQPLTQLMHLSLEGCDRLSNDALLNLQPLTGLTSLDLSGMNTALSSPFYYSLDVHGSQTCPMNAEALIHLVPLTRLTTLNIRRYNLTDQGLTHLCALNRLRRLNIAWCSDVTDAGLNAVRTMTRLTALDLRGCRKLTIVGLEKLHCMSQLKSLKMENFDRNSMSGIRSALPHCKVNTKKGKAVHHIQGRLFQRNVGVADGGLIHGLAEFGVNIFDSDDFELGLDLFDDDIDSNSSEEREQFRYL